jgi:hypothetical protein
VQIAGVLTTHTVIDGIDSLADQPDCGHRW